MNRRQQINKILHDHIDVDKNTDYTNYKKLITAIEEWHEQQVKSVDLADVGGSLPTNGEIEAYAMYQCGGCSPESCDERAGIITGAKWMRQKLIKLLKQ